MKQNKLKRYLETMLEEYVGKHDKMKYKLEFAKITTVTSEPLLASFKVAYRIVKCKRTSFD